jgi:NADH-quinone oxidoreductase subunit A
MTSELILSSVIFAVIGAILLAVFLGSKFLGPQNKDVKSKHILYESGVSNPVGNTQFRFSVKFYLVAILFVLFDVEIIFMFPWAVNLRDLGLFGLIEMLIFMALLFSGLIYIYKKKALSWD